MRTTKEHVYPQRMVHTMLWAEEAIAMRVDGLLCYRTCVSSVKQLRNFSSFCALLPLCLIPYPLCFISCPILYTLCFISYPIPCPLRLVSFPIPYSLCLISCSIPYPLCLMSCPIPCLLCLMSCPIPHPFQLVLYLTPFVPHFLYFKGSRGERDPQAPHASRAATPCGPQQAHRLRDLLRCPPGRQ